MYLLEQTCCCWCCRVCAQRLCLCCVQVQRQALRLTDVLVEAAFTTGKGVGTLGSKEPQRGVSTLYLCGQSHEP